MESFLLSCEGYMVDTKRDDLFQLPSVKQAVKKIRAVNPGVPQPVTSGTRRLARRVLELLPSMTSTEFIAARESFMFAAECVTGARIGELAGAQVGHGVFADHYSIISWVGEHTSLSGEITRWSPPPGVEVGDVFCEHDNETSKTDVPRVMCVAGLTRGAAAIDLAGALERYWAVCGFEIVETQEGGWRVRRPDFKVVQVALQALRGSEERLRSLEHWLRTSSLVPYSVGLALSGEVSRLMGATDPEESKMFLNVIGGAAGSMEIKRVMTELAAIGIRSEVVLGPLLMKTRGKSNGDVWGRGGSLVLPMPILVKSTYEVMQKATRAAYDELSAGGDDPEMVLGKGRDDPKFGHHSWRRLADAVATETLARGECTEMDIDLHFGWKLKKYAKKMQLHYSDRGKRTARAKLMQMM